jgi:hypothetical protein
MSESMEGIDPEAAPRAFEELLPLLDAQTEDRNAINTSIAKAIICAASVGRMVKQPEVRALFASLPATHFDMLHVDRLESAAMATWYAELCLRTASTMVSSAKLPEAVVAEATALKQRMFRVAEYNLDHIQEVVNELRSIRPGTGHIDLANDLMRLAVIFLAHADRLSLDTQRYQAGDTESARRHAHSIYQVLGDGRESNARYWGDYLSRAWTLLVTTYDEVSAAGRWLYRHDNGEARFPSLYAIGRQRRSKQPGDGEGGEDEEPASPTIPAPDPRAGA